MTKRRWRIWAVIGVLTALALGGWWWDANRVKPLGTKQVDLGNGVTMDFVWIPPGEFMMGSPTNEVGREINETQHRVKISKGFWMGKYEVTKEQYEAVVGTNPCYFARGGNYPVENVSWVDAVAFCVEVKERTGLELRLPTEAEWEYACRAGTTTAYYTGDTKADLARAGSFYGNSERGFKIWKWDRRRREPRSVGSFVPNAWGLYDMHGNMWEWCADGYREYPMGMEVDPLGPENGSDRVMRGGSWCDDAMYYCRSANRGFNDHPPPSSIRSLGFSSTLSSIRCPGFRCVLVR